MDAGVRDTLFEVTRASDEHRLSFGENVKRLMGVGVERYHADLVRAERTYYMPDGESEVVRSDAIEAEPAMSFSGPEVEAAVRAVQAGAITYKEFCARVIAAGCVAYLVSIAGRRVVYYGRSGDCHVEWFPGAT